MRNEVIALEHKTNAVISVGIPIAVAEILGRNAVEQQVTGIEMVQPADNVEHRSLSRARWAQNGHELVIAKGQAHLVERHLRKRLRDVPLQLSLSSSIGGNLSRADALTRSPPPFVSDAFVLLNPIFCRRQ